MNYVNINLYRKPFSYGLVSSGTKTSSIQSKASNILRKISMAMFGLGTLSASMVFVPQISEAVDDRLGAKYVQVLTKPSKSFGDNLIESGVKAPKKPYQPVFSALLSKENRIVIDEIGVDAVVNEGTEENVEDILRKGVWRVSDFGTPYSRKYPTILAAHRFGYLEWTNQFRRENSFYNLPKLEDGDTVEIIWNQRKYVFEIYGESEGDEITDYRADLILYTCRFLDSDVRIFKYARLIEI
ncbi:sortase domain-bontaining protein [Patescibacteria group bacterium]